MKIDKEKIKELLDSVKHPASGQGLVEGGFVSKVNTEGDIVGVVLDFSNPNTLQRRKEPFAESLRKRAELLIREVFPQAVVSVTLEATAPKPSPFGVARVHKTVAIASGKGGVGKSSVAAFVAATLASQGYRVGLLDADIYGPSQPRLFGVEGFLPPAIIENGVEGIVPAESMGVKIMSIGFFVGESDAMVWRGPMAGSALKQMIHQTQWGELDFLLIDLPPGTGDIHLSVAHEVGIDGAIIVSTPQQLALSDVRRGVEMFRSEGINTPVWGVVENMAWFTPAELPDNRYYIFGRGGVREYAVAEGIDFLGDIPIIESIMESGENGLPSQGVKNGAKPYYEAIVTKIVEKASKEC